MPEVGKTPIQHYRTTTAAAVPLAGNMVDGELVIQQTDKKLFFKDNLGDVHSFLGNVDNTSDATKDAATATLTNKTLTSPVINTPTGIVKADVGLGNVDNTSDMDKPVSTAQGLAIDAVEITPVEAPTASTVPIRTATGSLKVANAAATNEAVALGQGDGRFAALAGLSTQLFSVQNATAAAHAVNRQTGDGRYQARNTFEFSTNWSNEDVLVAGQIVYPIRFPLKTPSGYRWRIRGSRLIRGGLSALEFTIIHDGVTYFTHAQVGTLHNQDLGPNESGVYQLNIPLGTVVGTSNFEFKVENTSPNLPSGLTFRCWLLFVLGAD